MRVMSQLPAIAKPHNPRQRRSGLLWFAQFFALLTVSLQVGVSYSHLMQFVGKTQLPIEVFIAVQTTLIQYKLGLGIVEIGAFLLLGLMLYWSRSQAVMVGWIVGAIALLAAAQVLWAVAIEPINIAIDTWTLAAYPPDWEDYRRRWHLLHLTRLILLTLGWGSLTSNLLSQK
jgi:hypothetical protein